ncbi:hypothetical protein CF067_00955 [Clostridium sporogenes]
MIKIHNESETNFSLCLGGKKDIEINTLIKTLEHTVELMNWIINKQNKHSYAKIAVKGTKEGSFVVDLSALVAITPTLFTLQNINLAKTCVDTMCGMINLKKHLKGEKPKKVEKISEGVKIENKDCKEMVFNNYTFNLYNEDSDKIISKVFNNCKRDSFSIKEEEKNKVFVQKKEFENMVKEIDFSTEEQIITNVNTVELQIRKPDLTGNTQWEFIYNNNIKATIQDQKFLDKVHKGEISINAKTRIRAELQIETVLNEKNDILKTNYTVVKVIEIIKYADNQLKF